MQFYTYECSSHLWIRLSMQDVIIFGIVILLLCALYLAFQTRKVKVKGLNDAKCIAIASGLLHYNSNICHYCSHIYSFIEQPHHLHRCIWHWYMDKHNNNSCHYVCAKGIMMCSGRIVNYIDMSIK